MSAVKALQQWCRVRCDGYRDVSITNMTTSFRDGLAFCALLHHHRPDLIDFDSLKKDDVYENNKLAFRVAEDLGIPALLDAEDMVALKVPDRLSILTYVSQYYNYFHGRSPIGGMGGMKRPAGDPAEGPSGKKNQPVAARPFPAASKAARENSPPPSSNITRPPPSPKPARNPTKPADGAAPAGTLSNKCASCDQHVHLVQRHLVEGKLYHRSCAKTLSAANPTAPPRGSPSNAPVAGSAPLADRGKAAAAPATLAPSRLGPSWLPGKAATSSSPSPPSRPPSSASPKGTRAPVASKPAATTSINAGPVAAPRAAAAATSNNLQAKLRFFQEQRDEEKKTPPAAAAVNKRPDAVQEAAAGKPASLVVDKRPGATSAVQEAAAGKPASLVVDKRPGATSAVQEAAAGKPASLVVDKRPGATSAVQEAAAGKPASLVVDKRPGATSAVQEAAAGKPASLVVNVAGFGRKKDASVAAVNPGGGDAARAAAGGGAQKSKASAAAFISKKLSEENNDAAKPSWTSVTLKKPAAPPQVETPKREPQGARGRKVLRVDPALLAAAAARTPSPVRPDRGGPKPDASASGNKDPPEDWRSKLKPISKPAGPSQSSPKPWANGGGAPQTPDVSLRPPSPPQLQHPTTSATPSAAKGFLNRQRDPTANGTKSESKKMKPDYISKEDIIRELQEIEDNLNQWEKRGVELEVKLRGSEGEGEEDSLMDEVMVEWFNLIRNKQLAIRRESELVYVGKTQDLEAEQPTVEQELRRLMDKPERLKTPEDRRREKQLMDKLVEIVNDRNAIVEGLDEDRLREDEEDEELNKMMMSLNVKKDKPKKKSPLSNLFGWRTKKEG
ncbi:protein-methionine sulfoxide oxidase mical2b [Pungitius pungitius]|uniref:protein-methionine sulfoxide oxidase mical2b n=1 Tax=Pungitius pungitius TaxID=134920 RepID=UPI002E160ACA